MHARIIALLAAGTIATGGCCNCMEALSKYEEKSARSTAAGGDVELDATYENADLGFSVQHPGHWGAKSTSENVIVIGGLDEAKPDFTATVNIQVLEHTDEVSQDEKVEAEIEHLKTQILGAEGGKVYDEEPFELEDVEGNTRKGTSMMFEYSLNAIDYKQYQIVLPGKDPNDVVTWAYTNHAVVYDEHLPITEAMLETWKLTR
ncbi:MAG: hypothetical protein JRG91_04765 [Deltaproteobacteria bacterium]|nr:hypothetical protein [Deltaproteobacteria bacterium]